MLTETPGSQQSAIRWRMSKHGERGRFSLAKSLSPHRLTTTPSHDHTTWQGTRENAVHPWVSSRKSKWQAASSLCHNLHLRVRDGVLAMTYTAPQTLSPCCPVLSPSTPARSAWDSFSHCSSSAPAALLPRGLCLCKDALLRCPGVGTGR